MEGPSNYSVLGVLATDDEQQVVGGAFLVAGNRVMTCAHVIMAALGNREIEKPKGTVTLEFVLIEQNPTIEARVVEWYPPIGDPKVGELEDIALLETIDELPRRAVSAIIAPEEPKKGNPVSLFGFSTPDGNWQDGHVQGLLRNGRIQLDTESKRKGVVPGFSGTAVWCRNTSRVLGMVVARPADLTVAEAYVTSSANLSRVLGEEYEPAADFEETFCKWFVTEFARSLKSSQHLAGQALTTFNTLYADDRASDLDAVAKWLLKQPPEKCVAFMEKIQKNLSGTHQRDLRDAVILAMCLVFEDRKPVMEIVTQRGKGALTIDGQTFADMDSEIAMAASNHARPDFRYIQTANKPVYPYNVSPNRRRASLGEGDEALNLIVRDAAEQVFAKQLPASAYQVADQLWMQSFDPRFLSPKLV
jgi:hypothetical protein